MRLAEGELVHHVRYWNTLQNVVIEGLESTEANYSWLRDVKTRLSVIDGTEALVEGFGASSGRAAPSF